MWHGLDGVKAENDVKNREKRSRNEPPVAFAFWMSLAISGRNTSTRCSHHTFFFSDSANYEKEGEEVHSHSKEESGRKD